MAVANHVNHFFQLRNFLVIVMRAISFAIELLYLFNSQAKDKDIVITNFVFDFNVGAVQRARW